MDAGSDASLDASAASSQRAVQAEPNDTDAGAAYDPEFDPANRNEDYLTFRSLVPVEHRFAEWPMPDSSPGSKVKPSYSATDLVVTDNVTKLRWQRHLPDTYPGCAGKYNFVGRDRAPGTGCTWEEAKIYCSRPELAEELGGGEWRLPTKIEAESLVDFMRVNAIDPLLDTFPIDFVWTASPHPGDDLKMAWAVDYMEGYTYGSARFKAGRVRCVSSPESNGGKLPSYEVVAQEVVRDRNTGLVWQMSADTQTRDWQEAKTYCAELQLAGGSWRLPNAKELLTLVDPGRRSSVIDIRAFPHTPSDRFWTATEFINGRDKAFQVDFNDGSITYFGMLAEKRYARCVRNSEAN